jgi:hypothetical protein
MQRGLKKMRELLGVILKDLLRYQITLKLGKKKYLTLVNRLERISIGPNGYGYACLWPHTSKLHAPLVLPFLGKQLLTASINDFKFNLVNERRYDKDVDISVLIGHRGMERLPLLLATIRSFAAQLGVNIECIVIEQDHESRIKDYLPHWVIHVFQPTMYDELTYNRSATFNLGAKYAKGRILLLHDNDMLVPSNYCADILALNTAGYDVINLKRFVFYLSKSDSLKVMESINNLQHVVPEYIIQNLEAGGSVAITKSAFFKIGGMDEDFVGWGGEDIDFWHRSTILNRWSWGSHCLVHLWHNSQPLKHKKDNPNIQRLLNIENRHLHDRIESLRKKNWRMSHD